MADVPGEETDDVAGGSPGRLEAGFERGLSLFRIVVVVPVIVLLLSALVAAVTFVDVAVEANEGLDTLYLGVGVAVVIAALTAFLRYGRDT